MAGLKKKKKEKSGSPNTVLIVFLVLFVLVCIGLGVWVYYAEAAKEDLRTARVKSDAAEKAGKITRDYYQFLWLAMREAAGDKLDGDELTILNASREEFGKAGYGTFKDQKNNDLAKKVFEDLHESMALPKEDKTFEKNLMTELKVAKGLLEEKIGDLKKQTDKNIRVELEIGKQNTKQDAFHQTANAAIQKGNQAALNEAKLRSKEFDDLNNQVKARVADIVDLNAKILAMEEDKDLAVKKKDLKIRELVAELNDRKSGDVRDAQNPPRGDSAPLVLDISPGKPLWDAAVGKITRVEADLRTVQINLGSAHGVKPELTFNIFSANASNRAIGKLKGTIEVIKVIDPSTSIARITSLYDASGDEIGFNEPVRSRVAKESESPLKEGDLLFNMFWGTRVAISGYVSITGDHSDNPAEQYQQMQEFAYLLQRQGMTVDAYVDLRDGQLKGKVTGKTRYLIRGEDPRGIKAAAKAGEGDEPEVSPEAKRLAAINDANRALLAEARDKGVLVISAENFAAMIGYRRIHSANEDVKGFRPGLPMAGTSIGGGTFTAPAAAPMPPPKPKKDAEPKDAGN